MRKPLLLLSSVCLLLVLQGCARPSGQDTEPAQADITITHQPSKVYTSIQGAHIDAAKAGPGAYANNQYLTWLFHLVFTSPKQAYRIEGTDVEYRREGKVVWKESLPREYLQQMEWIEGAYEPSQRYFLDNIEFTDEGMKSLERRTGPDVPAAGSVTWVRIFNARQFFGRIDEIRFDFQLSTEQGETRRASHTMPVLEWQQKVKLRLPFNGTWVAASGNDLITGHRRTGLNALTMYGWDFMKVGPNGRTYRTDGATPEDFYTYREEVLAPGDGVVVDVRNDIAETGIGETPPRALIEADGDVFSGNMVVIDHGNGEYTLTCHMLIGSVRVKVGDRVKAGTVLGLAGNSGVSGRPHIHINLMDGPSWLEARGVPAQFSDFKRIVSKGPPQPIALGNPMTDWVVEPAGPGK